LAVSVRPHWINGWFLRLLARPFVVVDGRERQSSWGEAELVTVPAGEHDVAVFLRYKGTRNQLGMGQLRVQVRPGDVVRVSARNGWLNSTPFRLQQRQ
jgi:hypothetical protein